MATQKKTGGWLTVYALEQLPVTHTFGIPGVQNTEIYDALNNSKKIQPILVTHEGGASFMADAISRTSSLIGVAVIVPGAGVTHAMSGIGESFLAGIPMIVIAGGIRRDIDKSYQLHELDLHKLLSAITKKTYLIKSHSEIVSTIFEAYSVATSGEPGPVFVEIPVNLQIYAGEIENLPVFQSKKNNPVPDSDKIKEAADLIANSSQPGMFLGWGARDCSDLSVKLAELLNAPVSTTLQGLSVFSYNHPLHTGMGFGPSSVPASENAFKNCDCLIAIGARFGEIPTGSYGVKVPENLIHIDINSDVFNKNYPAKVAINADASDAVNALLEALKNINYTSKANGSSIKGKIKKDKQEYIEEWKKHITDKVNPCIFFEKLRNKLSHDAITVCDDGNHTFLTEELFPMYKSKHFISPTDFNCMGYCIPAAIGAKLVNPEKQVIGIVGDGAFLMTCMEIITASTNNLGVIYFVFYDGELSQIAQGQEIPYNRKVCTILGKIDVKGVADATGAAFLVIEKNDNIDSTIDKALEISKKGQPVIVDVKVDYSKRTKFTKGVVKTVFKRFPLGDKIRFIGRAIYRKIID
ncbi:MAG: thiamine pyrophosphate-binding protein [Desulfobacterales bacterium]|nr:thiamine pyrophosphate-binding protein [Desulfobacterales bacterium]